MRRKREPTNYQSIVANTVGTERGPIHFIDPGITGTGHATWIELPLARATRPDDYGCVKGIKRTEPWQDRSYYVSQALADGVFSKYGSNVVVVEEPCVWSGNDKSEKSVKKGDILKLMYLVGQIAYVCREFSCPCIQVKPHEWKGNMNKAVVIERIKRALKGWSPRSHDADAVGMGLSAMGVL